MKIKLVEIGKVIPYARNPRRNEKAIDAVAASIKEFGWKQPIVVDTEMVIIAGHTRLEAARKLGLEKVPVFIADDLTPEQVKAYRITDNKSGEKAEWDDELLKLEFSDLKSAEFDLQLTGFSNDELGKLLKEALVTVLPPDEDPKDIPAELPKQAKTVQGDFYEIGEHRLYCGDSTVLSDVDHLFDDKLADLIFTDPPYGVAVSGAGGKSIQGDLTNTAITGFFPLAFDKLKVGKAIYICGGACNFSQYSKLFEIWCKKLPSLIIWDKQHFILRHHDYHAQFEIIAYGWKPGGRPEDRWYGDRKQTDVWGFAKENPNKYIHPTQKPVELVKKAIENSSPVGGLVYEPFGGSGSTMVASQALGRVCYAMEIDPAYCTKIVNRMHKLFPELVIRRNGEVLEFEHVEGE